MKLGSHAAAGLTCFLVACGGSSSSPSEGPTDGSTDATWAGSDDAEQAGPDATAAVDAGSDDATSAAPDDGATDAAAGDSSADGAVDGSPGDAASADATGDATASDSGPDAMVAGDAGPDAPADGAADAELDAPAAASEASSPPGLGLGTACTGNAECVSAVCIPVVPGAPSVCVTPCTQQSDCAAAPGFFCDPVSAGSSSGYCVAHSPEHCASCAHDADCGSLSESCFLAPGDSQLACQVDCSLSGADACPPDYTCTDETVNGTARKLCRPTAVSTCLDALGGFCDRVTGPQPCDRANAAGVCTAARDCDAVTGRLGVCGAAAPTCKTDCSIQDPAGCTESFCAAATTTPTNCGACGTVCPGYMQAHDNVTCDTGSSCTFSCQGENYDVDGAPADGCEVSDSPQGNHTQSTPQDLGTLSCEDSSSNPNASGTIPSDARVHENAAVVGFDPASGSAPDWYKIEASGGLSCNNDIVLTLTVTGSVSPACYKLTVMTDKNTYSAQTNAAGTAAISQTNGQYSDNTVITLEVQKTCSTSVVEDVSYTVTGHL